MTTRVINIKKGDPLSADYVYIGRPSKWGNPFVVGRHGSREEVIQKFRDYAKKKGLDKVAEEELQGKILGCYCKPLACHGDILAKWAEGEEA